MKKQRVHPRNPLNRRDARTRRRLALALAVILVGSLLAIPASAEIYHYVDDDGNHHYTSYRVRGMELLETFASEESSERRSSSSSNRSNRRRSRASTPRDHNAFDDIIREASAHFDIPFEFIKAVIKVESAFNPRAVSRVGAQGLMQLMPGTADDMGVSDAFDPRENIFGGTRYLRLLSDRYDGDINLVLSAYNAGPGRVQQYQGIPYEATRRYVQSVYRYYQEYLEAAGD